MNININKNNKPITDSTTNFEFNFDDIINEISIKAHNFVYQCGVIHNNNGQLIWCVYDKENKIKLREFDHRNFIGNLSKNEIVMNNHNNNIKQTNCYCNCICINMLKNDFYDKRGLSFSIKNKKEICKLKESFKFINRSLNEFKEINPKALNAYNNGDFISLSNEQKEIMTKLNNQFHNSFSKLLITLSNAKIINNKEEISRNNKLNNLINDFNNLLNKI